MGKIILDLCGGTGSWSKPYRDAGYDVRVITLPQHDVTTWQIHRGELIFNFSLKSQGYRIPVDEIYGILAAPTCTMFSLARTTASTPRDFQAGLELVNACIGIIQAVRTRHKLTFWALENPMGYLRQFLGRPPLTFNPADYGDPHTKKTDLWGFYNEPKKKPIKLTAEQLARMSANTRELPQLPADYILPAEFSRQAARRSMTPQGFAQAFYEANK